MAFDIERIRARFPALAIRDGDQSRIYFDNPAGTQVPQSVVDAMSRCLIESNANVQGPFATSERADAIVAGVHDAMADMLNASSPDEIIFGQNMTTLTLHMSRSIGRLLKEGDEIILSRMDHDANVAPWLLLARDLGLEVKWLPFDTDAYEFDVDVLDELLSTRTKLVCVGAASNYLGTINDVRSIADKARSAGAMTYVDAVQYVPHVATDVQACWGAIFWLAPPTSSSVLTRASCGDARSCSNRWSLTRFVPRPSISPAASRPARRVTKGWPERPRPSTTSPTSASRWAWTIMSDTRTSRAAGAMSTRRWIASFDYEAGIATHLISGLQQLPGVRVHGITDPDAMTRRVPTVIFTVDGVRPSDIAEALGQRNIFVWHGHNYAVEAAKHIGVYDAGGAVRVGPVHYNTIDEIDTLLNALSDILPRAAVA